MELLPHEVNQFNGVVIKPEGLSLDPAQFGDRLYHSLATWRERGHLVVWLELPVDQAMLIAPATSQGFRFHHTEEESVTLTYRLAEGALIPTYATHYLGAGGVVVNPRRELLVVNERHRRDHSRPYWKLPGGALHPNEHLADAVVREVFEETGVRAEFDALVCFRHWHGYRWGKSDIYFVCRLHPISEEITIQLDEIEDARWMPVDEYLGSDYVSPMNKRVVHAAISSPGLPPDWIEGYGDPSRYEFFIPRGLESTE
jgi:8-oxo-dGTP pyrophosphatase MutT (NUDIX family)